MPFITGSARDQPSYRMIQSVEAQAVLRQSGDYFGLSETQLTKKRGHHRQQRALVMELLHRNSGLKQRMIGERMGGSNEGLVSRDRRAIRQKIDTDPEIRKWFHDLHARLST